MTGRSSSDFTSPNELIGRPANPIKDTSQVSRIEAELTRWATEFARECQLPSADLRIHPALHYDEAAGLALAVSSGLVSVRNGGRFRLAGAMADKGPYNLFSRGQQPALNREYLIQIACFAELVLNHDWTARNTVFEYDSLDLATFDPNGQPVVAVEAKRSEHLLDLMLKAMQSTSICRPTSSTTNAARKLRALSRLRPEVFWAVAPGVRRAFDVDYSGPPRGSSSAMIYRPALEPNTRALYAAQRTTSRANPRLARSFHSAATPAVTDGRASLVAPVLAAARTKSNGMVPKAGLTTTSLQPEAKFGAEAEFHYIDWDVSRCKRCRNVWQVGEVAEP
jgi:hypothetical protein